MKKISSGNSKTSGGFVFTNTDAPSINLAPQRSQNMLKHDLVIPKYNADLRSWGRITNNILKSRVSRMFSKGKKESHTYKSGIHRGKKENKLFSSIRPSFDKEPGGEQIEVIGFKLERHGVFLQKGVGRGYTMNGDTVQRTSTKESSLFRERKNWYNGALTSQKSKLEKIVIKHNGDSIVLNTKRLFV